MSFRQSKVLSLIPLIVPLLILYSSKAQSSQTPQCFANPIARVLSGSSDNYEADTIVCSGAEIVNPQDVVLQCFSNQAEVRLPAQSTVVEPNICTQGTVTRRPNAAICDTSTSGDRVCSNPKGPESISQFRVLEPDEISGERPSISWERVDSAQSYTVDLSGPRVSWQRVVNADTTELPYPQNESSLTVGTAYEITIAANGTGLQTRPIAQVIIDVEEQTAQRITIQLATRMKEAQ